MEIVKIQLEIISTQIVKLPAKAKLLTIESLDNKPWLFALVNPDAQDVDRVIKTYETGDTVKSSGKYIGTYKEVGGGTFIYHTFDEGDVASVK